MNLKLHVLSILMGPEVVNRRIGETIEQFKLRQKVYDRAHYLANKQTKTALNRAWKAKNKEALKEYNKAYFKAWMTNNPHKEIACKQRRRARKVSVPSDLTARVVRDVFIASDGVCSYCLKVSGQLHLEHCTPLSRGGWNTIDNVVVACSSCNLSKGTKTVLEYVLKVD
jgi:5-methylcytosine-specific restriction endonuclease McrA